MKKKVLLAALLIIGCSKDKVLEAIVVGHDGKDGQNATCTVEQTEAGAHLTCSDSSSVTIVNGTNGQDGTSCSASETETGATITCGDSAASVFNGTDGQDGTSATVSVTDYPATSCTAIPNTPYYTKRTGSNNFAIYTGSTCASSTKKFEVSQGEAYPLALKVMALWTTTSLRVFDFN